MAGSNDSGKARRRPNDGKVVVFSRVDPGLPPLFDEACQILLDHMDSDERRPERPGRSARTEYALREVIHFAAENYRLPFVQMLNRTAWADPELVRDELHEMGLGEFASAVGDPAIPPDGRAAGDPRRKR